MDLVPQDLEQPHDTAPAHRGEAVDIEPADRNRIAAKDHRLNDIGAAANRLAIVAPPPDSDDSSEPIGACAALC